MDSAPIEISHVDHFFGEGALRKQILHDISVRIDAGEIVIVTGPSGSGKTTLLTLIGALRSTQQGSLRVLGDELCGANAAALERVRRRIGYIFQAHNLVAALSASQNVQLALMLGERRTRSELKRRADAMLADVGLGDRVDHLPEQLSGGQRQRVAIARALAGGPRLILADEPTASLDKQSGRDVVEIMRRLAREQGVPVLLVTHDSRILDVADRIVHLEDGRLSSFTEAVIANTEQVMSVLSQTNRKGELARRVATMDPEAFRKLLDEMMQESLRFLEVTQMSEDDAFGSMLEQAVEAFTRKLGQILETERASLFLLDPERRELWLRVAQQEGGRPVEARLPIGQGIAGSVAASGESLRVDDAYAHPLFNRAVDAATGFRTRTILCIPVHNRTGEVFAVAQLLNRRDGQPFSDKDEKRFAEFVDPLGVILETLWTLERRRTHSGPSATQAPGRA